MFLVPALFTLLILLFEPSVLTDTRPEYGYWGMMWIIAKLGFFVWVLRQPVRSITITKNRRTTVPRLAFHIV
jgi:hypothetical protein